MLKRDSSGQKKLRCYFPKYIKYGFMKSRRDEHKPECFLCGCVLSNEAMKPSKLQRHLETKHSGAVHQDIEYFKVSKQECSTIQSTITRTSYS